MSGCLAGQATSVAQLLVGYTDFSVVGFTMAVARSKQLGVVRNPLENEPDHVLIFGNKTDSTRRWLAKQSTWVEPPPAQICKKPGGCDCVPRNIAPAVSPIAETRVVVKPALRGGVLRSILLWLRAFFMGR
jgi:hypothetical protein